MTRIKGYILDTFLISFTYTIFQRLFARRGHKSTLSYFTGKQKNTFVSHVVLMNHLNFEVYLLNDGCILVRSIFTSGKTRCIQMYTVIDSRRTQFPKKVNFTLFANHLVVLLIFRYPRSFVSSYFFLPLSGHNC